MDSEHGLAEHVNCNDEARNKCEMEESPELTEMGTTDNMTVPATTCYEKDVNIEELLRDTPKPSNHGPIEDPVEDSTDKSNPKKISNMPIEEMKKLVETLDIEDIEKRKKEWKKELRKMLAVVLETLKHNKSLFDKVENITWDMSTLPDQIGILEKYLLKEKYELWTKIWTLVDSKTKWEDYYKLLRECWEDFEEQDFKTIEECNGLGVQMETQRARILKTVEEYFRKAGIIV